MMCTYEDHPAMLISIMTSTEEFQPNCSGRFRCVRSYQPLASLAHVRSAQTSGRTRTGHCATIHCMRGTAIPQAAQALEPAALIPLPLLSPAGHVVLVGDPAQLPATVLSGAAAAANLAQSLFERLQRVHSACC